MPPAEIGNLRLDWVYIFIFPAKHGGSVLLERSKCPSGVTISITNSEYTSQTLFNLQKTHSSSYLQTCVTRQRLVSLARSPWNSQSTKVHALKTQSPKVSSNHPLAHALRGDTLGPFTPPQLPVVLFGRAKIHIRNA